MISITLCFTNNNKKSTVVDCNIQINKQKITQISNYFLLNPIKNDGKFTNTKHKPFVNPVRRGPTINRNQSLKILPH